MTSQTLYNSQMIAALVLVPFVIILTPAVMVLGIVLFVKTIRIK